MREDTGETLYLSSNIVDDNNNNVILAAEKIRDDKFVVEKVPIKVLQHCETEPGLINVAANIIRTDTNEEFLIFIDKSEHIEKIEVLQITDTSNEARRIPIEIGYITVKSGTDKQCRPGINK